MAHFFKTFNINFANDWIRTADLWCRKQPLYQLSHNHCPLGAIESRFSLSNFKLFPLFLPSFLSIIRSTGIIIIILFVFCLVDYMIGQSAPTPSNFRFLAGNLKNKTDN